MKAVVLNQILANTMKAVVLNLIPANTMKAFCSILRGWGPGGPNFFKYMFPP